MAIQRALPRPATGGPGPPGRILCTKCGGTYFVETGFLSLKVLAHFQLRLPFPQSGLEAIVDGPSIRRIPRQACVSRCSRVACRASPALSWAFGCARSCAARAAAEELGQQGCGGPEARGAYQRDLAVLAVSAIALSLPSVAPFSLPTLQPISASATLSQGNKNNSRPTASELLLPPDSARVRSIAAVLFLVPHLHRTTFPSPKHHGSVSPARSFVPVRTEACPSFDLPRCLSVVPGPVLPPDLLHLDTRAPLSAIFPQRRITHNVVSSRVRASLPRHIPTIKALFHIQSPTRTFRSVIRFV